VSPIAQQGHGLNFSRYPTKKKKDYEPGRWAELRQNENKEQKK